MILFAKRFLYTCKFSGVTPNNNTILRQIKEVCKIQIIKNKELNLKFPSWEKIDSYLGQTWPASIHAKLNGLWKELHKYKLKLHKI